MAIKIIPYCEVDGIRTYKDSEILGLYDKIKESGRAGVVFYDGGIKDREGFLSYMKHGDNSVYIVEEDGEIIGLSWLNMFRHKTAYLHFCFTCEWGKAVEAAKIGLAALITMRDAGGRYLFDMFMGAPPLFNKHAIAFVKACGGKSLGVLPNAVWIADRNKSEDAELIYFTR